MKKLPGFSKFEKPFEKTDSEDSKKSVISRSKSSSSTTSLNKLAPCDPKKDNIFQRTASGRAFEIDEFDNIIFKDSDGEKKDTPKFSNSMTNTLPGELRDYFSSPTKTIDT